MKSLHLERTDFRAQTSVDKNRRAGPVEPDTAPAAADNTVVAGPLDGAPG